MISRERWQLLEPVLDAALDLPAGEVSAYLDRRFAGAPELREEMERLLAALRAEGGGARFLESPPTALAVHILSEPDADALAADEPAEGAAIGPYRVLRRLGRGGMGVVYLARDPRLERLVALKLLPPWLAADEVATRRLAEEAKAASALDHPNIETVYDIGRTDDGCLYFAMAYYEGETLATRIHSGPLPVEQAVAVAVQLARGVEAAHARGIVHRDVKPANVILTPAGVAKIVDFGVAKATGTDLTEPGATPGTAAYMSPEQTRGAASDGRTDIWSLGVVLYEMLAGGRPFRGDDHDAVIFAIRHDQPEPLLQRRPEVPEPLARVVHRCLEKDPRARYQDAGALANALREIGTPASGMTRRARARRRLTALATTMLLVAILGGGSLLWPRLQIGRALAGSLEAPLPVASRLAVLPMLDSSADPEDPYFADALTEELISRLSMLAGLHVIAHSSVTPYRGTEKSIAEVAGELGVATVLGGTVRKAGERIHLSLRLTEAGSERPLWTEDYDERIAELPAVQRDVAQRVTAALRVRTGARERRQLAKRGTENADAYMEYLKGRYFVEQGETWKARDHFERSLDLDPTFAAAWAGLSRMYIQSSIRGLVATSDAVPRARAAAERALELDPELAEGHAHLAGALNWYYWDREGADRHIRQALELDPNAAWVHRALAGHLRNLGRFEQALSEVGKVRELDPLNSAGAYNQEGVILYFARRYDEAIAKFQQLFRVDPGYTDAYFYIALVYTQMGQYEQALASLRETDPQVSQPDALTIRGYVYARLGQPDEARRALARLEELSNDRPVSSFHKAVISIGLGEYDRALDLLEQAAEERTWHLAILKVEPVFDPVRGEPRFQALLEKMHLSG